MGIYFLGMLVSGLFSIGWAIYSFYSFTTHQRNNLKKIGMELNWLFLDVRWKQDHDQFEAKFFIPMAAGVLVMSLALSWASAFWWAYIWWTSLIPYWSSPRGVKDAKWRLRHQRLSTEQVIKDLCLINGLEGEERDKFIRRAKAELGNEGTERKAA